MLVLIQNLPLVYYVIQIKNSLNAKIIQIIFNAWMYIVVYKLGKVKHINWIIQVRIHRSFS
jgi:hypothetical protein